MYQYAAVLGHQPHISIAELSAAIPNFTLLHIIQKQVVLFESSEELDPNVIHQLGGTVVLAEQITNADVRMSDAPQILLQEVSDVKKKVTFGLRCFGIPKKDVKTAYIQGKEALKKEGRPCRYVGNENKPAATALLYDAELLSGKKGVELFFVQLPNSLWVGRTMGAQDIDYYTWRDMEKPVRDTGVGLLPPKLAQILLNLGKWATYQQQSDTSKKRNTSLTVFDPFCGTGVIPLECLLLHWNVLASDVSQKAVNGTQKNIEWLRKEEKILKKDVTDTVWKHDATKPFDLKTLPDVVVTETSLGENLEKRPTKTEVKQLKKAAELLEEAFLRNASETLPHVPLVCTFPFWRLKGGSEFLEHIWNVVDELGYTVSLPLEEDITITDRGTLLYQRPEQFVGREIVVLLPPSPKEE